MISYWENDIFAQADFIVIGAGIIGLSTAISLQTRYKKAKVLVIERGTFPTGASTRNAGFACFGSLTELAANITEWGEDTTYTIVEKRKKGLELLRNRLRSDEACGYEQFGGYELITQQQSHHLEAMHNINTMLSPIFGSSPFLDYSAYKQQFGFGDSVTGLLYSPYEGQIHSGKTMASLAMYAKQMGIEILYGVNVQSLCADDKGVDIDAQIAPMNSDCSFRADYVAVCTNAMIPTLLPGTPIVPGRGQVLITSPIENILFRGVFHYDEGYYYFRNVGNRILLGGGRNIDFAGEQTYDFSLTDAIQYALETLLQQVIIPNREYRIEHKWSGIMGFSDTKLPIVKFANPRIAIGFGCNGMGVALGSLIGEETANLFDQ
ncbi:MAG: FAD-binding oxidoreductase [Ignavibacteria bacterium]|nr:FAD-binding oxidoreductase [Ignavibacteria bacterium]